MPADIISSAITGSVTISAGGVTTVTSQGSVTATGAAIVDYGTLFNYGLASGTNIGVNIYSGGIVTNQNGGRIVGNTPGAFGVQLSAGGSFSNYGLISGSDGVRLKTGGTVNNAALGIISGSVLGVYGIGTVTNAGIISGPSTAGVAVQFASAAGNLLVVDPGAVFSGTVEGGGVGNTLEFSTGSGAGTFAGIGSHYVNFASLSIDTGATWTAGGVNTIAAGQTLRDAGKLTFTTAPTGGGDVVLAGSGITLAVDGGASIGPSLGGLAGNAVELVGTVEGYAALSGHGLTLSGGTVLNLVGSYGTDQVSVTNDGANTFITACFASGTEIATARGAVAVEALCVGERVVTVSGRLAPVVWMGFRRLDLRRHARPFDVMPVRVLAGALGDGVPARDVVLSPDHAVLVGGHLVPVRYLVNGRSILQETREAVTYWHVELDRHELVLAEGMACESYLDTGNRDAFENGGDATQLHPAFGRDHALAVWQEAACAPILFDPREPALRALHTGLLARAERLARAA